METEVISQTTPYVKILRKGGLSSHYLYFGGIDNDIPIHTKEGRTILSDKGGHDMVKYWSSIHLLPSQIENDPAFIIDESAVVHLIMHKSADNKSALVDTINTYLDCVKPTDFLSNIRRTQLLYAFADHMTFNTEYAESFFGRLAQNRTDLCFIMEELFDAFWKNVVFLTQEATPEDIRTILSRFGELRDFDEYK